jgi:hypothetical protein
MKISICVGVMKGCVLILLVSSLLQCISVPSDVTDLLSVGEDRPVLDEETIIAGLKEALEIGTDNAVQMVSKRNGFLNNPAIFIPLPGELEDMADVLKRIGMKKDVDKFINNMNHAAEEAAKGAADIFIDAITEMTLTDARNILEGADNAATTYFENKTRRDLYDVFYPVVKNAMDKVGLTNLFKFLVDTYNGIPGVRKTNFELNDYITNKGLDGLFYMLAEEEKKIRIDPVARVTDLLKEVFGSI